MATKDIHCPWCKVTVTHPIYLWIHQDTEHGADLIAFNEKVQGRKPHRRRMLVNENDYGPTPDEKG